MDFMKIKKLCSMKNTANRIKKQARDHDATFAKSYQTSDLCLAYIKTLKTEQKKKYKHFN